MSKNIVKGETKEVTTYQQGISIAHRNKEKKPLIDATRNEVEREIQLSRKFCFHLK